MLNNGQPTKSDGCLMYNAATSGPRHYHFLQKAARELTTDGREIVEG
jgi:hypothetical protein